jgi:hypothetical protein
MKLIDTAEKLLDGYTSENCFNFSRIPEQFKCKLFLELLLVAQ